MKNNCFSKFCPTKYRKFFSLGSNKEIGFLRAKIFIYYLKIIGTKIMSNNIKDPIIS
jgi:hypothetical protein